MSNNKNFRTMENYENLNGMDFDEMVEVECATMDESLQEDFWGYEPTDL